MGREGYRIFSTVYCHINYIWPESVRKMSFKTTQREPFFVTFLIITDWESGIRYQDVPLEFVYEKHQAAGCTALTF